MRDRNVQLGGGQRPGKGRIGVAVDQKDIRLFGNQRVLNGGELLTGHVSMRTAAEVKPVFRRGKTQLAEEYIRHVVVVVLAGVQQHLFNSIAVGDGMRQSDRLDELRPRADNGEDFHGHTHYSDQKNLVSSVPSTTEAMRTVQWSTQLPPL